MINKENVLTVLQRRSEAQLQYIEAVKDDIKLCDGRIIDTAVEFEIDLPLLDTDYIKKLKVVTIPNAIFNLIDEEYVKIDVEKYIERKYKYYEVDGIRFRPEF